MVMVGWKDMCVVVQGTGKFSLAGSRLKLFGYQPNKLQWACTLIQIDTTGSDFTANECGTWLKCIQLIIQFSRKKIQRNDGDLWEREVVEEAAGKNTNY